MKNIIYKILRKNSPCLYALQHEIDKKAYLKRFYTNSKFLVPEREGAYF